MTDTNELIKNVAIDIIGITSIWAVLNNPYLANNYNFIKLNYNNNNFYISNIHTYLVLIGTGTSIYLLRKYM